MAGPDPLDHSGHMPESPTAVEVPITFLEWVNLPYNSATVLGGSRHMSVEMVEAVDHLARHEGVYVHEYVEGPDGKVGVVPTRMTEDAWTRLTINVTVRLLLP